MCVCVCLSWGNTERGGGSETEVFHSWIIPLSCQDLYLMSEITCGRRSCRKEEERKAGGLMAEKGAYAKGIQVCAPPHISVTGHGWPAG